ncbi:hypothetical protein T439DRAFT_124014 [Meredithblackwellia eburnea MCA 4105]
MEGSGEIRLTQRRRPSGSSEGVLEQWNGRRRTILRIIALAVSIGTVAWLAVGALTRANTRQLTRRKRTKIGFSAARLSKFDALNSLPSHHSPTVQELLSHPLLTNHTSPTCELDKILKERYEPLAPAYGNGRNRRAKRSRSLTAHDLPRHHLNYFVAINLHSSASVLPALIHALHALLWSLGPERFTISIFENGSADETPAQLFIFSKLLDRMGVGYTIVSSDKATSKKVGTRIAQLVDVRNLALAPLYEALPGTWDRVLFLNDVHLCEAELKELLLQHEVQEADMSCGMDYKELKIKELKEWEMKDRTLFYDLWIARDMAGLPFYKIKWPTGDWVLPSLPLPHSDSRGLFHNLLPFQVYSCFNGVTVLDAALFHPPYSIRFRSHNGTEAISECFLLCQDIWRGVHAQRSRHSRGARIQVVPRVSVGYEVGEYETMRKDHNTSAFIETAEPGAKERQEMIHWKQFPPKLVAHYPFARWNEEEWIPPLPP